jgi:hypothetical protein
MLPLRDSALSLLQILLLVVSLTGCRDVDVVTATYATLAEARQAGAFERGWMPSILPPGAHDIREAHDLDTSRRWGLFDFTEADDGAIRRVLSPGEASLDNRTCDMPRRVEWWPRILRGQLDSSRIRSTGLRAYRSTDGNLLILVNWNQRRAYYCSY